MRYPTLGLIAAAALLVAGCAQDQAANPASPETTAQAAVFAGPGHGPHRLFAQLDLTAQQQEQIRAIFANHKADREAIRAAREKGATDAELKAQHEALREKIHAEIAGVLTAEQKAQLEKLRAQFKQNGPGLPGKGGRALSAAERSERIDRRMAWLTEKLSLTSAQQTAIRELFATRQAKRAAQKSGPPDREAMRLAREEFHRQLEALLDADQIAKLKEIRPAGERVHRGWPDSR